MLPRAGRRSQRVDRDLSRFSTRLRGDLRATGPTQNHCGGETQGTALTHVNFRLMTEDDLQVIARMRQRVEQCRRLAAALTDRQASEALLRMAEEGEADIRRLESTHADPPAPAPMPKAE